MQALPCPVTEAQGDSDGDRSPAPEAAAHHPSCPPCLPGGPAFSCVRKPGAVRAAGLPSPRPSAAPCAPRTSAQRPPATFPPAGQNGGGSPTLSASEAGGAPPPPLRRLGSAPPRARTLAARAPPRRGPPLGSAPRPPSRPRPPQRRSLQLPGGVWGRRPLAPARPPARPPPCRPPRSPQVGAGRGPRSPDPFSARWVGGGRARWRRDRRGRGAEPSWSSAPLPSPAGRVQPRR